MSTKTFLLGVFCVAVVLRVLFFIASYAHHDYLLVPTIIGDDGYFQIATHLAMGNGFSDLPPPEYRPNPLRPPVYPFFIAGLLWLFGSHWPVLIAQILVGGLIPILGYLLVRMFVSERLSSITAGMLALNPMLILYADIYYTETLFIAFFLASVILFVNYIRSAALRPLVWSAVLFSLALLIKPTIQYVPIIIVVLAWFVTKGRVFGKMRLVHLALYPVLCLIFVSPWLYRNYVEFGVASMGAQPAYNLSVYLLSTVRAIDNGTTFRIELDKIEAAGLDHNDITPRTSKYYTQQAIPQILEHKQALVYSIGTTAITFFTHDGMLTVLQHVGVRPEVGLGSPALFLLINDPLLFAEKIAGYMHSPLALIILVRLFWITVFIFSLYGVIAYARRQGISLGYVYVVFLVAYFAATTSINGLGVNARFRMPVEPIILMFGLYGLSCAWKGILEKIRSHPPHVQAIDSNPVL